MRFERMPVKVGVAVLAVALLAGCEGAVERNLTKFLEPGAPRVDADLRDRARAHSQEGCDAGRVLHSSDPEGTYGSGAVELADRQALDPAREAPDDDHAATRAIWRRFSADALLGQATWDDMGVGQVRCDDGYLYLTVALRDDGLPQWAPGVRRVTAGNGPTYLGGITTDGTTVAVHSRATDLVPGTTVGDIYLYDLTTDTLTPTGVEPEMSWSGGVVLTPDGSTAFYGDRLDPVARTGPVIRALDVATGTTSIRAALPGTDLPFPESTSADGSVLAYQWFQEGVGARAVLDTDAGVERDFDVSDFSTAVSVSDDGRYVAVVGAGALIYDRSTQELSPADGSCISEISSEGSSLSADGRYLAYSCYPAFGLGSETDLFVWDRSTGRSQRITPEADDGIARSAGSISDDGRFVAYSYTRYGARPGDGTYLWDRTTGRSTLIAPVWSVPTVSGDGSVVAFTTAAAPGQTGASSNDLYVWSNPAA